MATDASQSDRIFLEGMLFYGYHGVNPEERTLGQRILVDLTVTADLRAAGTSDDVTDTISYSDVYRLTRSIVEGQPKNLLEAVAGEIAEAILANHERAGSVTVTIRKPEAPIRDSVLHAAGVSITRSRRTGE